ncbi:cytochrome C oxidase subunit IV family protein [Aquabacterium sp.]|jgi:hypothetical protein|uniref:cytochrome C oxidase subunit IV family protein n=1 Tax=Aquabacterium sp. TaxID=1872578 RepID=UPI0025B7DC47|nr:cytochrome C oxidase subunit IV family protein [Aquabacterium sp.]
MSQATHTPADVTRVWLLLLAITGLTTYLVEWGSVSPAVTTTAALCAASFKARLVILNYMELRDAPLAWRSIFEAWNIACLCLILGAYWWR